MFWYRFNSIGAQKKVSKKVLPTFFISISYVRTTETRLRILNLLSANPTKRSNTLKQFVGNLPTNCLRMFDYFVKLLLKGLKTKIFPRQISFFERIKCSLFSDPQVVPWGASGITKPSTYFLEGNGMLKKHLDAVMGTQLKWYSEYTSLFVLKETATSKILPNTFYDYNITLACSNQKDISTLNFDIKLYKTSNNK